MTSRVRIRLALLALLLGVASGCSFGDDEPEPPQAISNSAGGYVQEYAVSDRGAVQDFEAELLGGGTVSSAELDGRVSVINVWGSWCAPCRSEAPILRAAAERFQPQGVRFLGLNVRDNDASAKAFERRYQIPYRSITSADSPKTSLAFGSLLAASAVPTTLVLDTERRVAARVTGEVSASTLRALIETALAEADGS